ncbi:TPA: hypothetical protein JLK53_004553 [Escherichia coli]|nr:hypothetical protein [Escherichia coli]
MSRIISTTVYTLDELSDAAREKARNWYREHALNDDWYQNVLDEFTGICNNRRKSLLFRSLLLTPADIRNAQKAVGLAGNSASLMISGQSSARS